MFTPEPTMPLQIASEPRSGNKHIKLKREVPMLIRIPKGWEMPEREATPESVYLNRRALLKAAGFLGAGELLRAADPSPYPAKRNPEFTLDRPITEEWAATGYNNFYEFDPENKEAVKDKVGAFVVSPWTVEIGGLVGKPGKQDV